MDGDGVKNPRETVVVTVPCGTTICFYVKATRNDGKPSCQDRAAAGFQKRACVSCCRCGCRGVRSPVVKG